MKKLYCLLLLFSLAAFAQQGDLTGFAGRVNASQYGSWAMPIFYGTPAGAGAIIVGGNGRVTLPDGVEFVPFKVGTPVRINDGPNTETVTPTAIGNCGNGKLQNTCTITAVFTKAHGGGATCTVTSGTAGLQEAINALLSTAGLVVISGSWNGTTSMITTTATGSTAVGVEDLRVGIPSYYAWSGSHYTLSAGSGNPVVLNPAGDQTVLNGFNFIVDAGGGIEAANSSSTTASLGLFMLASGQGQLAYFNPTTGSNTFVRFNSGGSISLNPVAAGADDGGHGVVINNSGLFVAGTFADGVSLHLTQGSMIVEGGGLASGNPIVTFGSSGVEGVFKFFPQTGGGSYTIRSPNTGLTNVINWPNASGTLAAIATTLSPSSSVCTDINSLLTTTSCGSTLFSAIGAGTNTSSAMLCGTGCSLGVTGSGTINSTTLLGSTWASPGTIGNTTPGFGYFSLLQNVVSADAMGGANCTAKIANADSFLGANPGLITVSNLCGASGVTGFVLSANHNLYFTQGGTYVFPKANRLLGNNEVWGVAGAIIQLAGGSNSNLFQVEGNNVSLHNLTLDGNAAGNLGTCTTTFACGHLIEIQGTPDSTHIYNNTLQNTAGNAIFYHANGGAPPTNINVDHNTFVTCGRDCIRGYDQSVGYRFTDNIFKSWFCSGTANFEDAIFMFQNSTNAAYQDVNISRNKFLNGCNSTKFAVEFVVLNPTFPQPQGVVMVGNESDCNGSNGGCGFSGVIDDAVIAINTIKNSAHTAATGGIWRSGLELSGQRITITGNTIPTGSITVGDLNQIECSNHITITGNHVTSTADFATTTPASGIYLPGNSSCLDADFVVGHNDVSTEGAAGTSCQGIWIGNATIGGLTHVLVDANIVNTGTTDANCIAIRVSPKNGTSSTAIQVLNNITRGIGTGFADSGNDTTEMEVGRNDFSGSSTPVVKTGSGTGYRFFENITIVGQLSVGPGLFTSSSSSDGSFGSTLFHGASACETSFATTTLSNGATTTDTGLNCLPANSTIDAVVARVTTTITAACTGWELGDAATPARFSSNNVTLTAGTTTDAAHIGTFNNTGIASATTGTWQASAAKVRITCAGGNPGAGAVRVIVYYHTAAAPTS